MRTDRMTPQELLDAFDAYLAGTLGDEQLPVLEAALRAGTTVKLDRGLAALRFRSGARLVIEGPAEVKLVSAMRVELVQGKVGARVPESAQGFTVLSPRGEVIDLGTEFGVGVGQDGA